MRHAHLLCIPLVLTASVAFSQTPGQATATLVNAAGEQVGTATIEPAAQGDGVQINATLKGLPPGTHAFHIHTAGKCDPPAFTTAGGHFNPTGRQHGHDNPNGAHAGDLPNFEVQANGEGHISDEVPGVTLGDGPNSLFHPGGTALVIHAAADDNKTDPAGNAGARIACGVIEKAKS
jgi:Cu-Zn family superoxide dismutase